VPARPANQTRAIVIIETMIVVVIIVLAEMITMKPSMTRSCKRLKHKRVRLKNAG
jgi:competence protein ComGC